MSATAFTHVRRTPGVFFCAAQGKMTRDFGNVLSPGDVKSLLANPTVQSNKNRLDQQTQVDFSIDIPQEMCRDLSRVLDVPLSPTMRLRWIRGDSTPHIDHPWDCLPYHTTYLVYLTDSDGIFYIDHEEHPITAGRGYSFPEGVMHGTRNTTQDRLLLGPFNERQTSVGMINLGILYYSSATRETLVYAQSATFGTLLSIHEINRINGDPSDPMHQAGFTSPITIPIGRQQTGWVFSVVGSTGKGTLNGQEPRDGQSYHVGASYTRESISQIALYPEYGDVTPPPRWSRLGKGNWPRSRKSRRTLAFAK